jgi:hypothetical protein
LQTLFRALRYVVKGVQLSVRMIDGGTNGGSAVFKNQYSRDIGSCTVMLGSFDPHFDQRNDCVVGQCC